MRIAIVVYRGAALSLPFRLGGSRGGGGKLYGSALCACVVARGAARGGSGAIWTSAPGSFFSVLLSGWPSSVSKH